MEKLPGSGVDVAFEAIANIHSGQCFGYELLSPRTVPAGADVPLAVLDSRDVAIGNADWEIALRRRAAEQLGAASNLTNRALFHHLDHRAHSDWGAIIAATWEALGHLTGQLVSQVTVRPDSAQTTLALVSALRAQGGMVAIDCVGGTADCLKLLHAIEPDFIKIDPWLIRGIDADTRKRVVATHLVGMAHTLGLRVIAPGIDNVRECQVCRELGFDLVQGRYVDLPNAAPNAAEAGYPRLQAMAYDHRRRRQIDQKWVLQQLEPLPAISIDTPINEVFGRVARTANQSFIPVVDALGHPLGILHERSIKNFAYSAFGKDLIANKAFGRNLRDLLVRCPVTDLATPLDQLLAIYSAMEDADGILITERMTYRGFLSARSLIRAMHEKTLARARDENPLTKLAGNAVINEYIAARAAIGEPTVLAYVDFDNFKPFNDTYGFRQGDRAILMFAELLRKAADPLTWFLGHIGGDDFFVGLAGHAMAEGWSLISALIKRFSQDANSFYDAEARDRGYITAQDREGKATNFPLLSASAVLFLLDGSRAFSVDAVSSAIAEKKKEAKASSDKIAIATPEGQEP